MVNIEAEIKAYLESALLTRISKYYTGEVKVIPRSYLPALSVMGTETNVVAKTTASDRNEWKITITVIAALTDYLDEAGTELVIKSDNDLKKIMEERNADGTYKTNTVLYALRHTLRGTSFKFNNDIRLTYRVPENPEFPYCRATCEVTAFSDLILRTLS